MIKNYFKIAWRNLFRHRTFSVTNILSLSIGMTCTILILLWVQHEVSYDKFQKNYDNIYQVIAHRDFENQVFTDQNMVLPLAKTLAKELPEVKNAVVTTYAESYILANGDSKLSKKGYTVSDRYFDMFSVNFVKGNAASAITDPSSIVLTESAAKSFFGNEDPINKVLKINNDKNLRVSAIVQDPPPNSGFQYDFIKPFDYSDPYIKSRMDKWRGSSWTVFVQTAPGINIDQLGKRIDAVQHKNNPDDKVSTYFAFPMNKWHLYADFKDGKNVGGLIDYIRLFSIIALIILLIACVNFMNLSTARSEKRAKEVGIRKTLGSVKTQLIFQFFSESVLFSAIALVFSIAAVYLLLPSFNTLVGKQLSLNILQPQFWIGAGAMILFTGIVAGSYPALYLSSFNPVKVLKGTFLVGKKAALPRQILVVGQFAISILLISATIIVYQQIQHLKNRDKGYNPDNLIIVNSSSDINKSFQVIKQELLKTGVVNSLSRTSAPITQIWWRDGFPQFNGKPDNMNVIIAGLDAEVDFSKTMGLKMLAGKDFSGTPSDSVSMLLNKTAADITGVKNPVGMTMKHGNTNYTVIGITDNVIMESPSKPVEPMMIFSGGWHGNFVNIRLNANVSPEKALAAMEPVFKKFNPAFPFEYKFADEEFGKKFETENLIGKLTNIFAGLAIFICCIGLAGLAAFTIEKRIREIGIRKVLGATVQQLLMLISKEFIRLVAIAFVIAIPVAWWFMHNWLQQYAYRIEISAWVFGVVGCLILLLALAVVCLNTLYAALANPVKSLRSE